MNLGAIIFDLFGTLVHDFAASSAGYHEEFSAALGVPRDLFTQQWRQLTERRTMGEFQTVEASIEHACGSIETTVTTEQMTRAVEIRLKLTRRALAPRTDAIATLKALRRGGFKIGLLSNCSIEIPIIWPETAFAGLFDAAVFSSRERIKKPSARIYRLACERLGVEPRKCLYVADGENYELAAAADVGMHPVLIKSAEPDNEARREAREWQGQTVTALSEVVGLIPK